MDCDNIHKIIIECLENINLSIKSYNENGDKDKFIDNFKENNLKITDDIYNCRDFFGYKEELESISDNVNLFEYLKIIDSYHVIVNKEEILYDDAFIEVFYSFFQKIYIKLFGYSIDNYHAFIEDIIDKFNKITTENYMTYNCYNDDKYYCGRSIHKLDPIQTPSAFIITNTENLRGIYESYGSDTGGDQQAHIINLDKLLKLPEYHITPKNILDGLFFPKISNRVKNKLDKNLDKYSVGTKNINYITGHQTYLGIKKDFHLLSIDIGDNSILFYFKYTPGEMMSFKAFSNEKLELKLEFNTYDIFKQNIYLYINKKRINIDLILAYVNVDAPPIIPYSTLTKQHIEKSINSAVDAQMYMKFIPKDPRYNTLYNYFTNDYHSYLMFFGDTLPNIINELIELALI